MHGGTVEAYPEARGHGSRFVVWLPAEASSNDRQAGDRSADLSVFGGARILLVEDAPESLVARSDLLALDEA